jgi:uncharacterized membrane-anchored protein
LLGLVLAALLSALVSAAAVASPVTASQGTDTTAKSAVTDTLATPAEASADAFLHAVGAPARADIGDQATDRLSDDLMFIPPEPAAKLLTVMSRPVPSHFSGLLLGSEGMDYAGMVRFIPAGFIDSNAALAWTPADMLASLNTTIQRGNAERVKQNLPELEARRWIKPPDYDPATHQLSWAALIVPKSEPRETDGEIIYHAIGFGRDGYIALSVVTGVQKASTIENMADSFLRGLVFRPGKAYGDAVPTDRRAPNGLAGAMGIDSFHKARSSLSIWSTDRVIPIAGGIVGTIGALSLLIYIQRHLRREARRG